MNMQFVFESINFALIQYVFFSPIVLAKPVFWIKMVYQPVMLVWKATLEEDVKSRSSVTDLSTN